MSPAAVVMHLHFKNLQVSPVLLGRFISAIMDFLPAPADVVSVSKVVCVTGYRKISPEELIDLAIENHITRIDKLSQGLGGDESFFVADLGELTRQHQRWIKNLPAVRPYYAVKCNSDPTLLKLLASAGTGFDCASVAEIRAVLDLGVDPGRIIFANPCKPAAALVFARQVGVTHTTFDNLDELDSIKAHMPAAKLLLRIYANDDGALISLADKFGAHLDTTQVLLSRAWELGLDVIGVSFHVGTGATNSTSFIKAIKHARVVFNQGQHLGFNPTVLDIGGGFQDSHFEATATVVRESIRTEFPTGVTTIAEPGRFYSRSVFTLVCRVISQRRQLGSAAAAKVPDMLYQSDGVYGNFMNVIMEKEVMCPELVNRRVLKRGLLGTTLFEKEGELDTQEQRWANGSSQQHRYSIWGPTCDSIDCVAREVTLPAQARVGDWLKYRNMGAYTSTTATQFNGFKGTQDILYVNSEAPGSLLD